MERIKKELLEIERMIKWEEKEKLEAT